MLWLKPKSCLGIDIGAGGIKLVELRQVKKRPVLFTYGLTTEKQDVHKLNLVKENNNLVDLGKPAEKTEKEPATEDKIEKYSRMLKSVYSAAKATSKSAVVSLPVSSVFHALVTLPVVNKNELDQMIKAEVKKLLPMSLEEMALDYQVIKEDKDKKTQKILVNAVGHDIITFYSKIFQKAGLSLEALEPESAALTRCLIGKDQAVTVVIDIGAERTNFFINDQGIPITHQTIESGGNKVDKLLQSVLGLEPDLVEQVKYDLFSYVNEGKQEVITEKKFLDLFVPVIDPIMKEIGISLEIFLRQEGNENKRPEKIVITGGMGFIPYLTKYISDTFKIKSFIGDPWGRVIYQDGLRPVLKQIGPRMSVAIGLALRNML